MADAPVHDPDVLRAQAIKTAAAALNALTHDDDADYITPTRCATVAIDAIWDRLYAYRTAALHYMDGNTIVVDRRTDTTTITWGVGGRDATEPEHEALADLCAAMGEPLDEDDDE